ncbi:MAG: dTDP-4-dehydrorhamnose reductase, partial [Erysipelotrichaceae bacterium]|nr:dTDP-4-dehydrorhamnose reductase [Erysipelotrichaceae bacterium]
MVTGKDGQLGHDILDRLKSLNFDVIAPARTDFDLSKADQVKAYIIEERPDVIIHCAAYTAVDKAEEEKDLCYMINVEGTRALAEAAKQIDAKVVYISTDYVFDGIKDKPHDEYEDTNPINHYGYTKEQGEKIIKEMIEKYFIVRTSWLYGRNGNNFVKKMIELAQTHEKISVVSDQVGAPTYTIDLAKFVLDLVATEHYGIYHGVNEGYCSWYEFAKLIFKE